MSNNKIILAKSSVPGKVPADLWYGELALNYHDGSLYYKHSTNEIRKLSNELSVSRLDGISDLTVDNVKTLQFNPAGFTLTQLPNNVVEVALTPADYPASPLVFTANSNYRTLTGYTENDVTYTVRTAEFVNNKLRLTLAEFTPTTTSSPIPGSSLNWDVPCTGFSVNVTNPTDFTDQWLYGVSSITATSGDITELSTFSASAKSAVPAGGVSWTQTFSTDADSYVRPVSTTLSGGSASATVRFLVTNGTTSNEYSAPASWSINWATPTNTISIAALSGWSFLRSYTSTTYSVNATGMSNSANYLHDIQPTGGTISNATGNGTFTFAVPIHKDNTGTTRSLQLTTTFTRPATVTGASYSVDRITSATLAAATFIYPSAWLWTESVLTVPSTSDVVDGTNFKAGVTALGHQVKTFAGFVENPLAVPQAFWFAVRSSAAQPTTFKTGASSSLLSDVSVTTGNTVMLYPTPKPSGYVDVSYTLYGITLQPGSTYVSIS